jgi:transcriptional regulator GlxA family with amidase domain
LIELVRTQEAQMLHPPADDSRSALSATLARAIEVMHESAQDPEAAHHACRILGTDYKTLNRCFMEQLGTTLSQYWLRERVRLAREQLERSDVTVTDVAAQLGFSSSQHFATVFRKVTGLRPSEYRNAAHGADPKRSTRADRRESCAT